MAISLPKIYEKGENNEQSKEFDNNFGIFLIGFMFTGHRFGSIQ